MAIEVDTTQYEFSHGKKPRGEGLWIFSLVGRTVDGRRFEQYERFFGKYGDTKRQAITAARAAKAEVVLVMP